MESLFRRVSRRLGGSYRETGHQDQGGGVTFNDVEGQRGARAPGEPEEDEEEFELGNEEDDGSEDDEEGGVIDADLQEAFFPVLTVKLKGRHGKEAGEVATALLDNCTPHEITGAIKSTSELTALVDKWWRPRKERGGHATDTKKGDAREPLAGESMVRISKGKRPTTAPQAKTQTTKSFREECAEAQRAGKEALQQRAREFDMMHEIPLCNEECPLEGLSEDEIRERQEGIWDEDDEDGEKLTVGEKKKFLPKLAIQLDRQYGREWWRPQKKGGTGSNQDFELLKLKILELEEFEGIGARLTPGMKVRMQRLQEQKNVQSQKKMQRLQGRKKVTFSSAKGPAETKQGDIARAETAAKAEAKLQLHQILLTKAREHDERSLARLVTQITRIVKRERAGSGVGRTHKPEEGLDAEQTSAVDEDDVAGSGVADVERNVSRAARGDVEGVERSSGGCGEAGTESSRSDEVDVAGGEEAGVERGVASCDVEGVKRARGGCGGSVIDSEGVVLDSQGAGASGCNVESVGSSGPGEAGAESR
eukprot:1899146-Rhodomonas_salina.1